MNYYIDIDLIKRHLNIDSEYQDEDEYLLQLAEVALSAVENHVDCSLEEYIDDNTGQLPAPMVHACLLMIGNLYQNRESVAFAMGYEVPLAYRYLLQPYIKYDKN